LVEEVAVLRADLRATSVARRATAQLFEIECVCSQVVGRREVAKKVARNVAPEKLP
jgi:hypothetical protein